MFLFFYFFFLKSKYKKKIFGVVVKYKLWLYIRPNILRPKQVHHLSKKITIERNLRKFLLAFLFLKYIN